MDEILQNLQHSLSLYEIEYRLIEARYAQIKAHHDYLGKARDDAKRMIAEREEILKHRSSNNNDFEHESNIGEVPKFGFDESLNQNQIIESNDKEKAVERKLDSNDKTPPVPEGDDEKPFTKITFGMFVDMSLIQAVVKLLRFVKIPLSNRQISEALLRGGYKTAAHDFTDTVRSTLKQYKAPKGEMLWLDNKWELKEWIPVSK